MPEIIIDKENYEHQMIDRKSVIEELGNPVDIGDVSVYYDEELIDFINKNYNLEQWGYDEIRYKYVRAYEYSTEQENNDLTGEMSFTIYCQEGYGDAFWSRDCYVVVDGDLYFVNDGCLGDTEFFSWKLGWYVMSFNNVSDSYLFDDVNNRLSAGYSSDPTRELNKILFNGSVPVWSDKRKCFVGRVKDYDRPVELHPSVY